MPQANKSRRTPRPATPAARLRREANLTQREAARLLGALHVRTLQREEARWPGPKDFALAERMAKLYGSRIGRAINPQFELYGLGRPSGCPSGE